jgi:hypothetical protein
MKIFLALVVMSSCFAVVAHLNYLDEQDKKPEPEVVTYTKSCKTWSF